MSKKSSRFDRAKSFKLKTKEESKARLDLGEIEEEAESDTEEKLLHFTQASSDEEDAGEVILLQTHKKQLPSGDFDSASTSSKSSSSSSSTSPEPSRDDEDDNHTIIESFKASSPQVKKRIFKSLNDVVVAVELDGHKEPMKQRPVFVVQGGLSQRLSRASTAGATMVPKIIFPAAPKLFRDGWVLTELLLTIVQFIYSFFSTDYGINKLYNGIYITLSSVNFVLALVDSYYYFFELGSCMDLYKWCRKRMRKKKQPDYESLENPNSDSESISDAESNNPSESDTDIDDEEMDSITREQSSCLRVCRLSPKRKEQLNMWFELIRNILSELLIYPLVVLDLFGIVTDPEITNKLNFSFFLVGSFYLVLSVYIARVMISVLTLLTMKNLLSSTQSGKNNVFFIVRFLFHSLSQVVVHICCIVAVGIKIQQENDNNDERFHASPIVWVVIFGGWFIPFLGVISYFIVNYFWAQQFSIGFFIELMSLLQEGDVVGSLMHSKDEMKAEADERAHKILEKMEYKDVKKEYKQLESSSRISKVFYPVRLPLFILLCISYNFALGGFFTSLLFTSKDGDIVPIQFNDSEGIALLVIIAIITLANIHLILITNSTIIISLGFVLIVIFLPGVIAVPVFIVFAFIVLRLHKLGKIV